MGSEGALKSHSLVIDVTVTHVISYHRPLVFNIIRIISPVMLIISVAILSM
jgi:hypothetical protein